MSRFDARRFFRGALVALIALAFAASALAHRVPSRGELQFAAFEASFGGASGLCGGGSDDGKADEGCPFCHLVSSVLLPDPGAGLRPADAVVLAEVVLPQIRRVEGPALDHVRLSRGPPLA